MKKKKKRVAATQAASLSGNCRKKGLVWFQTLWRELSSIDVLAWKYFVNRYHGKEHSIKKSIPEKATKLRESSDFEVSFRNNNVRVVLVYAFL